MTMRFTLDNMSHASPPTAPLPLDLADFLTLLEAFRGTAAATAGEIDEATRSRRNAAIAEAVFVPESYEPNYAYPLIIWLNDPASREGELCRVMPQISTRNYFGVSVRAGGNVSAWKDEHAGEWEVEVKSETAAERSLDEQLFDTVTRLRGAYHIHTERIYLAGFGDAGTRALQVGLAHPEWFAGIASLGGRFPESPRLLARYFDLRGMRIFLGAGSRHPQAITEMHRTSRLLHTAGLRVCARVYDAGHEVIRPMLNEIDRWVMREICEPEPVC